MVNLNHPNLSLEVIERIIDIVTEHENDPSSIKACSLVSHSILPRCRYHIFASVTLNARVGKRAISPTSDNFNHLLSNSPHLAVYVRDLDYHFNKREFVAKRLPWLISMFKKLVKLQELRITYWPTSSTRRLDWMSSSERKVLLPLLHLPTLTSISLSTIQNFALADLSGCVNLKELRIESLYFSTGVGSYLEALPVTPVMLERLVIDKGNVGPLRRFCNARRPDGKPIIGLSSLKEIEATALRLDLLKDLFVMCRNLRQITLSIDHEAKSLTGLFTMLEPSLFTLVNIYIEHHIILEDYDDDDCGTYEDHSAGLFHVLEKMAGRNVVEKIELLIWLKSDYDCRRWGELDDVLMGSPEGWPALRKVSLRFNVFETSFNDSVKQLQELPMTKLMESKQVQFDFEVEELPY